MSIFLSKQSRFATNSPISFIFNLIIRREGTKKPQDLLLGKIYFVLSLLARNTANHSYASSLCNFVPRALFPGFGGGKSALGTRLVPTYGELTGNQLEYEQLRSKPSSLLLISEDELISIKSIAKLKTTINT